MPDKSLRIQRAGPGRGRRPVMLAIAGDSAAGKTTLTRGLVEALGPQKLNVIGVPGSLPLARLQQLGVARVSYGPWSQNVALTALAALAEDVQAGGGLPDGTRKLN